MSERQLLRAVFGLAVTAAVVASLGYACLWRKGSGDPFGRIVNAANSMPYRTLQSRLAGPFSHRPLRPSVRGGPAAENGDSNGRLDIIGVSSRLAETGRSPRDLHNLGISYLFLGKIDHAVAALERAIRLDAQRDDVSLAVRGSRNADLLTDLSAAYLERASRTQTASDRVASVVVAQHAWTVSNTPETAWNRALALEQLHFRDAIRHAWTDYLRLDNRSPWSMEARAQLAAAQQPTLTELWTAVQPHFDAVVMKTDRDELRKIVSRFPQQVRIHAEDVVLQRWLSDDSEATFQALQTIAQTLAEQNGDHIVLAITDMIRRATPDERSRLQDACRQYASAKRLYENNEVVTASKAAQSVSAMFAAHHAWAPASLADVIAASTAFVAEDYAKSFDIATRALTRLDDESRYPSLVLRLEWIRGLCHLALGRPHESLRAYERALSAGERAGEKDSIAVLQNLRGEAQEAIGDREGGLESRLAAVRTKSAVGGRNKAEQILSGVTRALFVQGHLDVALHFSAITLAHPQFGDRADFASEVLLLRGIILQQLGQVAEARAALISARRYALQSGDAAITTAMLADIDAALALSNGLDESPRQQLTQLTTALVHAQRTGNHYHQSRLLLQRARAARAVGDATLAEIDLKAGLGEVDVQGQMIPGRQARAMYFASARELVTDYVQLLIETGRIEDAFDVAERARAQGLLDPASRSNERVLTYDQIAPELNRGETLVSNIALRDYLVTWIVTQSGIRAVKSEVGYLEIERLLLHHNTDNRAYDRAVYEAVIASVDAVPLRRCVFVSDPALPPVILAVLKDRRGSHLIEKYPIVYAPSATAYVRSIRLRDDVNRSVRPKIFAAAASFFDSTLFKQLLPLPATETEVARIAAGQGGVAIATGRELTIERFVSGASDAEIVHFAGHATGGEVASTAALVMAPDAARGDVGLLYAQAIADRKFPRTRLVVLSACGVVSRADVDARAIGSIAYAFLAADVPAVIATVRPVHDHVAADFGSRLHDALMTNRDAAVALQETQLSFIRNSSEARDPRNWAAFRLYGHYER